MKSLTEHLWFEVPGRRGFVNMTDTVEALVRKSGVNEGIYLVNAMNIYGIRLADKEGGRGVFGDVREFGSSEPLHRFSTNCCTDS